MKKKADIIVTINFLPANEGGIKSDILTDWLACIIELDHENYSVRVNLAEVEKVSSGQTIQKVPLHFYFPEQAKSHCRVGKKFTLKDINTIAVGVIEEVLFCD